MTNYDTTFTTYLYRAEKHVDRTTGRESTPAKKTIRVTVPYITGASNVIFNLCSGQTLMYEYNELSNLKSMTNSLLSHAILLEPDTDMDAATLKECTDEVIKEATTLRIQQIQHGLKFTWEKYNPTPAEDGEKVEIFATLEWTGQAEYVDTITEVTDELYIWIKKYFEQLARKPKEIKLLKHNPIYDHIVFYYMLMGINNKASKVPVSIVQCLIYGADIPMETLLFTISYAVTVDQQLIQKYHDFSLNQLVSKEVTREQENGEKYSVTNFSITLYGPMGYAFQHNLWINARKYITRPSRDLDLGTSAEIVF